MTQPPHNVIDELVGEGYLKTPALIEAFRSVPRSSFLPDAEKERADFNAPLPIGYGQTNSQPLTVAFMLELLQPKAGDRVLDVGAGSGWTVALFAHIVGERGHVRAVERIPQLFRFAQENLRKFPFENIELIRADATVPDPVMPTYDVIHVAAASPDVPKIFRDQLALHGRLLLPVGDAEQSLLLVTRTSKDHFLEERFPGFSFVPLVGGTLT